MESARNLPVDSSPHNLNADMELRLTAKNLRDLIAGQSIQAAQFGGVNLKVALHPDVDRSSLDRIIEEAKRTIPNLPPRTPVTGNAADNVIKP